MPPIVSKMQDTYFQLSTDYLPTSMSRLIYTHLPLKSYSLLFNFILCLFNNHLNYSNYFQVKKSIKAGERGQWLKVCSSAEALSSSTHVERSQQQLQGAIPCLPGLGVITALTSNKPTQTYTYN